MAENHKARPYQNMPFHMKAVDIIVPFHGEHDRVAKLLESIFFTVRTNRYRVTLVDDASPNSVFHTQFSKVPGVYAIRNDKQIGFGASVNKAIAHTAAPIISAKGQKILPPNYICIIQSDVVVESNTWLSKLGETLQELKDHGVKMVSPLTDNPVVNDDRLKAGKNELREDTVALSSGFLPMYCVLCHRELFKRIGKLKELPYAGGEAEEFAFRMKQNGFRQAVCGQSWVHHDGRATLSKYDNDKKVQEILRKAAYQVPQQPKK
jgi:GT2 family glycosyltransferase